jgi:hypothetical protein
VGKGGEVRADQTGLRFTNGVSQAEAAMSGKPFKKGKKVMGSVLGRAGAEGIKELSSTTAKTIRRGKAFEAAAACAKPLNGIP